MGGLRNWEPDNLRRCLCAAYNPALNVPARPPSAKARALSPLALAFFVSIPVIFTITRVTWCAHVTSPPCLLELNKTPSLVSGRLPFETDG